MITLTETLPQKEPTSAAEIRIYSLHKAYGGSGIALFWLQKDEEENISPYQPEEEMDIARQEELPINIYVVAGILAGIIVLIIVIKIYRKTSGKRKAKKDRKKLFKHNKLH